MQVGSHMWNTQNEEVTKYHRGVWDIEGCDSALGSSKEKIGCKGASLVCSTWTDTLATSAEAQHQQ